MSNKNNSLAGLIGEMKARRIIKRYYAEEYPNPNDVVYNASSLPMADALSDKELLAINGVGPMALQAIRRSCEEKVYPTQKYIALNTADLRAVICPFLEQTVTKHSIVLFIAWLEDFAKAEFIQMMPGSGEMIYILKYR